MEPKFIHLRSQSSYSMLESAIQVDALTDLAVRNGMPAVALTDRNNLFGSLELALSAVKRKIQPIHGIILNILYQNQEQRDQKKEDFAEILLIAKDDDGYKNLLELSSFIYTKNNRSIREHITMQDLKEHEAGLIVLSSYVDDHGGGAQRRSGHDRHLAHVCGQ